VEVCHDRGAPLVPLVGPAALHLQKSDLELLPGLGLIAVAKAAGFLPKLEWDCKLKNCSGAITVG
jgi:hypothetical protein